MTAELQQESEFTNEITTQPAPVEEKKETDEDRNWKAFLEKRKEEQRLFDAEKEKNKQLQELDARRQKEIEDLKIAFQVMLEKKEAHDFDDSDQAQKKFVQDEIQRLFKEEQTKRRSQEESERVYRESLAIKQEMPDLLDVVTTENLSYLEYYFPETAIPLGRMPDGLEKTKLAYQAIKKHVKMAKKEKEKIEENLSKPKSVHSSYSNETTSEKENSTGVLSDKRRNETWEKMQRLISGEDEE